MPYAEGSTCCCGCFSVCDGTKVIAILSIVYAFFAIFGSSVTLFVVIKDPKILAHDPDSTNTVDRWSTDEHSKDYEKMFPYVVAVLVVVCVLTLAQFLLSIQLLVGASRDQATKCKPWLYFNFVLFGLSAVFTVGSVLLVFITLTIIGGFFAALLLGGPALIHWYYLNVVRQFIRELEQGPRNTGVVYNSQQQSHVYNKY